MPLVASENGVARRSSAVPRRRLGDGRRVLAVCVDAPAVDVAALERVPVARGDARPQPPVLAERENLGAVSPGDRGRAVGRAVVDDQHVRLRQHRAQLLEHGRQVRFLVPGRDEDERPGHVRRR